MKSIRITPILCAGVALLSMSLAGTTWAQPPSHVSEVHHIHGLAVDPRDPEILYIATHTGLVRIRPSMTPEWIGSHRFDLMGFTAHPQDTNLVYASGHPDILTYQREQIGNLGLLMSRDGGRTWQSVTLKGEADFHALTYSPRNGGELYGWSVAEQVGLFRLSTKTWKVERLPARGFSNVFSLAASPHAAGPLLAGTKSGLVMSRDWGVSSTPLTSIPSDDAPVTAVSYHQSDAHVVYAYVARKDRGLMRSRDGGTTWEAAGYVGDLKAPVVALAVGPGEHVAFATTGSDVLRSGDGGRTWQKVLNQGRPVAASR